MPKVGRKNFAYTPEGMAKAKKYSKRTGIPMRVKPDYAKPTPKGTGPRPLRRRKRRPGAPAPMPRRAPRRNPGSGKGY